eukprot:4124777-Heterocapsa_arctica.AAC.1
MHNGKQQPAENSQVEMDIGHTIDEETKQAGSMDIDDVQGHRELIQVIEQDIQTNDTPIAENNKHKEDSRK